MNWGRNLQLVGVALAVFGAAATAFGLGMIYANHLVAQQYKKLADAMEDGDFPLLSDK